MAVNIIDLQRASARAGAQTICSTGCSARSPRTLAFAGTTAAPARVALGRERDEAREHVAQRLDELSDDWAGDIAIL